MCIQVFLLAVYTFENIGWILAPYWASLAWASAKRACWTAFASGAFDSGPRSQKESTIIHWMSLTCLPSLQERIRRWGSLVKLWNYIPETLGPVLRRDGSCGGSGLTDSPGFGPGLGSAGTPVAGAAGMSIPRISASSLESDLSLPASEHEPSFESSLLDELEGSKASSFVCLACGGAKWNHVASLRSMALHDSPWTSDYWMCYRSVWIACACNQPNILTPLKPIIAPVARASFALSMPLADWSRRRLPAYAHELVWHAMVGRMHDSPEDNDIYFMVDTGLGFTKSTQCICIHLGMGKKTRGKEFMLVSCSTQKDSTLPSTPTEHTSPNSGPYTTKKNEPQGTRESALSTCVARDHWLSFADSCDDALSKVSDMFSYPLVTGHSDVTRPSHSDCVNSPVLARCRKSSCRSLSRHVSAPNLKMKQNFGGWATLLLLQQLTHSRLRERPPQRDFLAFQSTYIIPQFFTAIFPAASHPEKQLARVLFCFCTTRSKTLAYFSIDFPLHSRCICDTQTEFVQSLFVCFYEARRLRP